MSTNKVYGDAPNEAAVKELETRYEYAGPADYDGIDENCRIDRTLHSLFGASKVAADIYAQEYGRYFGLKVGVFRGGCLTGPSALRRGTARISFLPGKGGAFRQAPTRSLATRASRSATTFTVTTWCARSRSLRDNPRPGEVYNLGGGRENSVSMLEAIAELGSDDRPQD